MAESMPESVEVLAASRAARLPMADSFHADIISGSRCGESMLVTGVRAEIHESIAGPDSKEVIRQ